MARSGLAIDRALLPRLAQALTASLGLRDVLAAASQSAAELVPGATFVEIGPGNVLSGLLKRIVPGAKAVALGTADEVERFLQ